jgi:hypothetical protein
MRDDVLERWQDQGALADGPTAVFTYHFHIKVLLLSLDESPWH